MAYLKGYMVPPGQGGNITMTSLQYQALPEADKLDPDKYYFLSDLEGDYDNIRDIVAPTEYSTAVGGHSTGDEFILGDYLYKAISAIAQGDPIVTSGTGQNAALAGTIVDQLKALFDGETVLKSSGTASTCAVHNTEAGVKLYWISSSTLDQPNSSFIYGFLINFSLGGTAPSYTDENGVQIAVKNNAQEIYIRRLANGVWDTAWKQIYGVSDGTITFNTTNFTNSTSWVSKSGNVGILHIDGKCLSATTNDNVELMTLPEGFRPLKSLYTTFPPLNNVSSVIRILTNGKVYLYTGTSIQNYSIRVNMSFFV